MTHFHLIHYQQPRNPLHFPPLRYYQWHSFNLVGSLACQHSNYWDSLGRHDGMHHLLDLPLMVLHEYLEGSTCPCYQGSGQYRFRLALIHLHHRFLRRSNHLIPSLRPRHLPHHRSPPQTHHHNQIPHLFPLHYWLGRRQLLLRDHCCAPVVTNAWRLLLLINLRNQMIQ